MSNPKIRIKVTKVRKDAGNIVAEEVESGDTVTLNLSPKIKKSGFLPEEGKEYWAMINENWLNFFELFTEEDKPSKSNNRFKSPVNDERMTNTRS